MATNPDSISVSGFALSIPTVGADQDIKALAAARWSAMGRSDAAPPCARRVYCGTGGTLVVRLVNDQATSLPYANVGNGNYVEGQITHIMQSGTTASGLIVEF